MKPVRAVYPGTFDPMTVGHLDLIERSAAIFDEVVVAVAGVSEKASRMFSFAERLAITREVIGQTGLKNVTVAVLDTLLIDFCKANDVRVIVRGVRVYSDFEYEFQMALTNRKLNPDVETFFLMPKEEYSYITASTVREVARYGGETAHFVPACVNQHILAYRSAHPVQPANQGGLHVGDSGAFDR